MLCIFWIVTSHWRVSDSNDCDDCFLCEKKKLIIQCVSATVSLEHITEQRLQSCAHHLAQSFNHSLSLSEKKKESEQICKFQVNLKTVIEHYLETMRVLRRHWQATEGTVRDCLSARGRRGTGRPPGLLVRAGRPGRPCAPWRRCGRRLGAFWRVNNLNHLNHVNNLNHWIWTI